MPHGILHKAFFKSSLAFILLLFLTQSNIHVHETDHHDADYLFVESETVIVHDNFIPSQAPPFSI
jgi:hypothetical protein